MPADGTQIKQDINNDLGNKGYRGVRTFMIIATLIKVVDWVAGVINGNLSTWLKTADGQPGGGNADEIYRTGSADFRGGLIARTRTANASPMASQVGGAAYAVQVLGQNGGPAYVEFTLPGIGIFQFGVDTDGKLRYRVAGTASSYPMVIDTITTSFILGGTLANRKLVLYDSMGNEHQFYGFGANDGFVRFQVPAVSNSFRFFAGTSSASSALVAVLTGEGKLAIGTGNAPGSNSGLEVGSGWASFGANVGGKKPAIGVGVSLGWNYSSGQAESNLVWSHAGYPNGFLAISRNDGTNLVEQMRFTPSDRLLIGTQSENIIDKMRVAGSISGKYASMSANPSVNDVEAGYFRLIKNTSNGEMRMWVNDGGTMKSVLLS